MMKRNLSGMVPQLAMGMVVNFFFNGWVGATLSSLLYCRRIILVQAEALTCLTSFPLSLLTPQVCYGQGPIRAQPKVQADAAGNLVA